jgi:hypothetical protein
VLDEVCDVHWCHELFGNNGRGRRCERACGGDDSNRHLRRAVTHRPVSQRTDQECGQCDARPRRHHVAVQPEECGGRVNEEFAVNIPFPFFSPSAFFWRGEAARLRQACGQGHRSQACRRRSPAHDAGPAGVGTTNRLFGYLLPADDTRPTRRESIGGGATRRKLARTRSSYTAVLHQFDLVDRVPTRDKILSPTRVPRAGGPPPHTGGGGGGGIVSSRAHFADVLVMVLPCACRQAVHACLPGPTNAAVSSSASWSGLQHSSVRPLPVNSRYLY